MSWFRDCGIVKKAMDDALQNTQELNYMKSSY